jgi:DNA-binding NarL/FixJ family response regulator
MKILVVVEDDPDVRFLIETIFSMDSRFSVPSSAESAEDALEAVRTEEPDIIVLDHGLGKLNGLEAARQLKELAPQTKIILFTAHAELEARTHDELAIDAFLLKTDTARLLPLAQELTDMLSLM